MLKALFILDCDQCHRPFERAAAATEEDEDLMTVTWLEAADVVACWACESGWGIYSHTHVCSVCLLEQEQLLAALSVEHPSLPTPITLDNP